MESTNRSVNKRSSKKNSRKKNSSSQRGGKSTDKPRAVTASYTDGDVVKDPLDLRDLMYEGSLIELPPTLDNRGSVPQVLNQHKEGACTGFALAAVANYLLHNDHHRTLAESTSPRMLYEMARRYDEWPGEAYSGSSIRGAMKGWHRHGVCTESDWPYVPNQPGQLTPEAQLAAVATPLGSYFRVRHLHLNHMHAALREAGILLASAQVHAGWRRVPQERPLIEYSSQPIGGHAFAIVGYDDAGFWVQNSWGPGWGQHGFAHLSYEDWLENGWDCWVARLGVPISSATRGATSLSGRAASFDFLPDEAVVLSEIRPHFINLGNDGELSQSGRYANSLNDLANVFSCANSKLETGDVSDILLYAHGGLNSETDSARRIASMRSTLLANRVYPIHFMWETGLSETLHNIVREAFRLDRRTSGLTDRLKDRFGDLLDRAIELAVRPLGRALWNEMKENAQRASEPAGGATLAAEQLAPLLRRHPSARIHLVGHSAGSIFLAFLLPQLLQRELHPASLSLLAPACTNQLFETNIRPHLRGEIEEFHLFNLSSHAELDDSVGPYRKSLLHLVSRAFERTTEQEGKLKPLLGMEPNGAGKLNPALRGLRPERTQTATSVVYSLGASRKLACTSDNHGGFDNDLPTLNSLLRILRRGKRPLKQFS